MKGDGTTEKIGKILTCDLCEKEVFLEYIGEGEADGGFTRWLKFESKPDSWRYVSHDELSKEKIKHDLLCDTCYLKYVEHINKFFNQ